MTPLRVKLDGKKVFLVIYRTEPDAILCPSTHAVLDFWDIIGMHKIEEFATTYSL